MEMGDQSVPSGSYGQQTADINDEGGGSNNLTDGIDAPLNYESDEPPLDDGAAQDEVETRQSLSPHINIEPHLESNLNVIENQNNENLERDQERMEHSEAENTEEVGIKQTETEVTATFLDEAESDAGKSKIASEFENNESFQKLVSSEEKDQTETIEEENDCDLPSPLKDVEKGHVEPEISSDNDYEKESDDIQNELLEENDKPTDKTQDDHQTNEGNENHTMEKVSKHSEDDSEKIEKQPTSTIDEKDSRETSPKPVEDSGDIEDKVGDVENDRIVDADIGTDKIADADVGTDKSDSGDIETNKVAIVDMGTDKMADANIQSDNIADDISGTDQIADTESGKLTDADIGNKEGNKDQEHAENNGKITDAESAKDVVSEKALEDTIEKEKDANIENSDGTDKSANKSNESLEKDLTKSPSKNDGATSTRSEGTVDNLNKTIENGEREENIEFAQVNFESDESEKVQEEQDKDSTNKDLELDPIASEIASDVFDSVDDSAGADEELCIIPDTEREISQAEKDAAATIPPLRDISEASVTTSASETLEAEPQDTNKIKVYRYDKDDLQTCQQCVLQRKVKFHYTDKEDKINYICDNNCLDAFKQTTPENISVILEESGSLRVKNFVDATGKEPPSLSFIRKCASCKKVANDLENNLTWEIMDFCNEFCLSKYQREIGSKCSTCLGDVKSASLGKYCVRFGNDIRQFCSSSCLEQYKKGLKVCSYCQQDMSNGPKGFLAPVGEKGQFKDFCSKLCMEKYDIMTNDRPPKVNSGTLCSVCKTEKLITIEFDLNGTPNYFCGEPCFVAFSFVNNISPGKCAMCRRHFNKSILEQHTMYYDNVQYSFCSNSCENIYIIAHRKIVPCSWCKVKKYNFDMIKKYSKSGPVVNMCSINCLSLYQVSLNAVSAKRITCNYCQKNAHPMYHLTMSDATIRNFCSYVCVMSFQNQFPKQPITLNNLGDSNFPVPTGTIKKNKKCPTTTDSGTASVTTPTQAAAPPAVAATVAAATTAAVAVTPKTTAAITANETPMLPVISNVQSLASTNGLSPTTINPPGLTPITSGRLTRSAKVTTPPPITSFGDMPVQIQVKQHFIVRPMPQPEQRNVATMCSVRKAVKGIQAKATTSDTGMQTEKEEIAKILIPVPVPIYVPTPCHMYSTPIPVPVPFPIPVPIPIFIPTTRNSSAGIMKEIKKIQVKIPTDPYEAELLMMAEMVAEEKKEDNTDSESDIDDPGADGGDYSPEPVDASNTFGDDMLQMALKMATELDEPAVDLEGALTANTITAQQGGHQENPDENVDDPQPMHSHLMERGRKRGMRGGQRGQSKRGRRMSHHQVEMPMLQQVQQPPPPTEPQEKPDANMCLKYTFGVNAWKQWVTTKNAELEKSSRRVKLFKTEILQLTADELNYSLCLFVKEVRKPNGQEYAPDTIYYLCLGIQQYLFENGRIDNIFCDPYYEKFTDCLDEVAKKFSVLYNDSHYIVTRVEEEHLWESKQLGAHSPHVLLSTLMFFNTKHFNLTSVDEHMQLSFSHIMKHWKRNPNQPGASKVPGSRNVLLRFYPPQAALQHNQRKKKVYEQQENEENPLRCPVKLYEFYLSKCPESVKTRNDVFYLQPERSCVPDSPVWYSTMPLPKEALEKMLHRVKMVKEINVALLTS